MNDVLRKILIGLPTIFLTLLTAGYFSVYGTFRSSVSDGTLPGWQTILFVYIPDLVTNTTLTLLASILLLIAVVVSLTAEAYRVGSGQTSGVVDKILLISIIVMAASILMLLQGAFA